jgi:hypothetical protein
MKVKVSHFSWEHVDLDVVSKGIILVSCVTKMLCAGQPALVVVGITASGKKAQHGSHIYLAHSSLTALIQSMCDQIQTHY